MVRAGRFGVKPGDFVIARFPPAGMAQASFTRFEEASVSRSKLRDWAKTNYALPVMDFVQTSFGAATSLGLPMVVAHLPYSNQELRKTVTKALWDLQKVHPQSYVFGTIDLYDIQKQHNHNHSVLTRARHCVVALRLTLLFLHQSINQSINQ
jgi:hypothetical protein